MMSNSFSKPRLATQQAAKNQRQFYHSVWRWHFYAGLFTAPFLIILSVTGLIMLYQPLLEPYFNSDQYLVEPSETQIPIETQKQTVALAYSGLITTFIPAKVAHHSNQFILQTPDKTNIKVFIDPYTGKLLGELNLDQGLYALSNDIHGSLLIGDMGDRIMELTASFTLLLCITGVYLWWPKMPSKRSGNRFLQALTVCRQNGKRYFWRDLHGVTGIIALLFLVFFALSGLAWSGIWGGQFVQAWSSFPMERRASNFQSDPNTLAIQHQANHKSLNPGVIETQPWNLELSPLPESGTDTGQTGIPQGTDINLDTVFAFAKGVGFTQFRIHLPRTETGVYTLSANTMSGDVQTAEEDRSLHLDQYTGKVLADVGYQDYNLIAKSMAIGIALHQGHYPTWNLLLNSLACALVILLCISALMLWWARRPSQIGQLGAPPLPTNLKRWRQASWLMLLLSLFVPLAALCLISVLILDLACQRFMPRLKQRYQ